jgi:hypothetical protein
VSTIDQYDTRRFPRVTLKSATRVFPEGSGDGFEAFVHEVGRGGIGLFSKRALDVDRNVTVKLEFTDRGGLNRVESVVGRVVHMNPSDNVFLVGIQFSDILSANQNEGLYAYIHSAEKGTH